MKALMIKAIASTSLIIGLTSFTQPAIAQVSGDFTLPNLSIVNQAGNNFTITGGTVVNTNLFHSFSQFIVPAGGAAIFNNGLGIQNIIARVTGSTASTIDGLIQANGNANLFLINPNGISFGANARLNLGGSFTASTANSVLFPEGNFSAGAPSTSPLLLVSVPNGLQFASNSKAITAQGNGNNFSFDFNDFSIVRGSKLGLEVKNSQTLALVGGDIALVGANLIAAGGRVELGSVASAGIVGISPNVNGFTFDYGNITNFSNINLSQAASVDTSGNARAGNIQVQGRQVNLTDGAALLSAAIASGSGTEIFVRATEQITATGSSASFPSGIFTDVGAVATGTGSNIRLATDNLSITGGAQISASTAGAGNAGNIFVNANQIAIGGLSLAIFTPSGIFSSVLNNVATGNAGNVVVNANNIQVTEGGQILTSTFGVGNAGNLEVNAKSISLDNISLAAPSSFSASVELFATGKAGNLTVNTDSLVITNGAQIAASTAGSGNAGNLVVNAKSVDLTGASPRSRSGLFANALVLNGAGGNVTVNSDRLTVRNGATISASNFNSTNNPRFTGRGSVGNIVLNVPSILLDTEGKVTASSNGGDRGNITLNSSLVTLRNGSSIATNALGNAIGGNININTDYLVAVPNENSDITANAVSNFGGRAVITAKGVFGFQVGKSPSLLSDITATSSLGAQFDGTVEIRRPDTELSRRLLNLPDNIVDESKQIASSCERFRGNEFIISGRGGSPTDATEPLSMPSVWRDLRLTNVPIADMADATPSPARANSSVANKPTNNEPSNEPSNESVLQPFPHIEAQTWEIGANGNLKLLASAAEVNSIPIWRQPSVCNSR